MCTQQWNDPISICLGKYDGLRYSHQKSGCFNSGCFHLNLLHFQSIDPEPRRASMLYHHSPKNGGNQNVKCHNQHAGPINNVTALGGVSNQLIHNQSELQCFTIIVQKMDIYLFHICQKQCYFLGPAEQRYLSIYSFDEHTSVRS